MPQTVQLKRSSVAAKVPLTTDLSLGELAINTNDGRLFFKKDPGTPSIVEVDTLDGTATISGTKTFTGSVYFSGSTQPTFRATSAAEGGQLVLAYANNTTAAGQGNSTWNIDVQDFTNQNLRFFRVNSSGVSDVALSIPDTGGITFNRTIILGTNGFSANGSVGTAGQVLTSNGSATYWGSAAGGSATNLGNSANSTTVTVTSSTGTSTTLLAANSTVAGVLSAGDQTIGGIKTFSANVALQTVTSGTWNGTAIAIANGGTGATTSNGALLNITGYQAIATSGGTTALTVSSPSVTVFTGTSAQTVQLPDATTLQLGMTFTIRNNSSNNLTIQTFAAGATLTGMGIGMICRFVCISTSVNTAAAWMQTFEGGTSRVGTGSVVYSNPPTLTAPLLGTPTSVTLTNATGLPLTTGVTGTLPIANGGTGATSAGQADTNLRGFTSTATAAGTTTLTNTSTLYQIFTGTTTQTVVLPVTSTLAQGWSFHIVNNSTGNLTVNSSGGNTVIVIPPGTTAMATCILTTGTDAASWEAGLTDFSTYTGTGSVVLSATPTLTGVTTVDLGASTYTDAIRIKSGTEAAGNPFMYLKKGSATGFVIGGFGTASEGSLNLAFPGHVGINTTPLAWPANTSFSVVQMKNDAVYSASVGGGLTGLFHAQNMYFDGTQYDYVNAAGDGAALYEMAGGTHLFATAPSGSPGTGVSTTTAMLIDNNAKVGIGAFGAGGVQAQLHVTATGIADLIDTVRITHPNAGATYGPTLVIHRDSASPAVSDLTGKIVFRGNNASAGQAGYAFLQSSILSTGAGTEDGQLGIGVLSGGAENTAITIYPSSVSVNSSISSTSTVSGTAFLAPNADTVSAPGHSWTGDTSTGLFHKGAGSIGVTISGTEEVNITGAGIFTLSPTSGYSQVMAEWTFLRTASGAAIGPAIADVFTSPSSVALEATGTYEITGMIYFTKTTAGTVTWTPTFSSAPLFSEFEYTQSPVTGMTANAGAVVTALSGTAYTQGTSASVAVLPSATTLTTAVNHFIRFRHYVRMNLSGNWRLRATSSAGTITPLAGSYYSVRKVSTSTGTFAA